MISYNLNKAYLIFRSYSESLGVESIGYIASLDTGAIDDLLLQDWDDYYLNFTRSYDKQNIIYVAAECCVCYGGTYYKLTDSGIIGITTDFEKSILIEEERFISLGERYYSVEMWDIDTLEYNNWTIKQEDIVNITQSVVPVEMLTLMASLLIISLSYFLKGKVGKSTIKK